MNWLIVKKKIDHLCTIVNRVVTLTGMATGLKFYKKFYKFS